MQREGSYIIRATSHIYLHHSLFKKKLLKLTHDFHQLSYSLHY